MGKVRGRLIGIFFGRNRVNERRRGEKKRRRSAVRERKRERTERKLRGGRKRGWRGGVRGCAKPGENETQSVRIARGGEPGAFCRTHNA